MPITATRLDETHALCDAYVWEISNRERLVSLVAHAAMGRHLALATALRDLDAMPPGMVPRSAAESAISKLTLKPGQEPWHRDGWLFQLIAWVAAHQDLSQTDLVRAPQSRKTDKGFDGIIVIVDDTRRRPSGVVVCEQKATDHPRQKLTQQVFPEFEALERGERDDELLSEVTTLLAQVEREAALALAEKLLWKNERQYRAALTVADPCIDRENVAKLFAGFDSAVKGQPFRRRAETIEIQSLREWFDKFANDVIDELRRLKG